ncbi:MAG TPA: hypothetical protein VLB05_08330 [Dongiaceae bacterium]|nr:hypothetical protein [Dongiaceae bacterium]
MIELQSGGIAVVNGTYQGFEQLVGCLLQLQAPVPTKHIQAFLTRMAALDEIQVMIQGRFIHAGAIRNARIGQGRAAIEGPQGGPQTHRRLV